MKKSIVMMMVVGVFSAIYAANYSYYEYVPVFKSEPYYKTITVSNPHRECWDETVQVDDNGKIVGGVIGGAAGGILGHQVGGGHGKDVATVAGAIVGTIIGSNMADNGPRYKTVTRCKTVYDSHTERRRVGYKNYFEINGKTMYKTSSRKLDEVRVRITVSY